MVLPGAGSTNMVLSERAQHEPPSVHSVVHFVYASDVSVIDMPHAHHTTHNTWTHRHAHMHMHTICTQIHIIHTHVYTRTCTQHVYIHTQYTHLYTHARTQYAHIHTRTHVSMHTHACMHKHTGVYRICWNISRTGL